jgi:hypothetical protein
MKGIRRVPTGTAYSSPPPNSSLVSTESIQSFAAVISHNKRDKISFYILIEKVVSEISRFSTNLTFFGRAVWSGLVSQGALCYTTVQKLKGRQVHESGSHASSPKRHPDAPGAGLAPDTRSHRVEGASFFQPARQACRPSKESVLARLWQQSRFRRSRFRFDRTRKMPSFQKLSGARPVANQ